jgi:excisionase family DNA binding protein
MRGLGDFQRSQMRDADSRISDLLGHLRHAIDVLEQIMMRPHKPAAEPGRLTEVETKSPAPSGPPADVKLSYTVKEVCKLVGISAATIYQVLRRGDLRAVKLGKKTLILAKDLQEWLDNLPAMR